jgi:hypothetical protein
MRGSVDALSLASLGRVDWTRRRPSCGQLPDEKLQLAMVVKRSGKLVPSLPTVRIRPPDPTRRQRSTIPPTPTRHDDSRYDASADPKVSICSFFH